MSTFDEVKNLLVKNDEKLSAKLAEHENQIKSYGSATNEVKADLKSLAAQSDELAASLKTMGDQMTLLQQKGVKQDRPATAKSAGLQVIESEAFKQYKSGNTSKFKMELKNTILGEVAGEPVDTLAPRQTLVGIESGIFRPLRVMDVIPQGQASSNTIHYTRELLWTNNAAETAEGAQKPESVLTFEAVDAPVRTIAHFIKVSRQVLDDAPMLQSYIDRRMRYGLDYRLETQIINGNGTSPNLSGILDAGNYTAISIATGDNDFDAVNKAKYQVIAGEYQADVVMLNPQDWGRMERKKVGAGVETYVGADGAINYLNNGLLPTLWGLPVVLSNSVPLGTVIVMARDAVMFFSRQGTTVEIFDQNEDDVEKNLLTIRAEMRGAFVVFRPAAIVAGELPEAP